MTNARSIKWRITAITVCTFIVSTATLVFLVSRESTAVAERDAVSIARTLTLEQSGNVARRIDLALQTTADLARVLETATAQHSMTRAQVAEMLKAVISAHPEYVGTTATWEPNAFDGNDAKYANTPLHDRTGRLLPYAFWANGQVKVEAVTGYDDQTAAGDWYNTPRKTMKSTAVDPYVYPINGVDVLMTTVATPMVRDGRFIGVTTIDISLESIQASISKIKTLGTGYAALISNGGFLVGYPKASMLNKQMPKQYQPLVDRARGRTTPVSRLAYDTTSATTALQYATAIPLAADGSSWTLITSTPRTSVLRDATALRNKILLIGVAGLILMTVLSLIVGSRIATPLRGMVRSLRRVEEGDLTPRFVAGGGIEIADMADALNTTLERTGRTISAITSSVTTLAAASDDLFAHGQRIGGLASATAQRSSTASSTATRVSASAQQAASSAAEAHTSVQAIAGSAASAAEVAVTAAAHAASVNDIMSRLSTSSAAISDVVEVITTIADQTNLLALNATIEATHAGALGKGFAVVASEVKELAGQTATATNEISRTVRTIQLDARDAVAAIGQITQVIDQMNGSQTAIAATVDGQATTTSLIETAVTDAASGSVEIAEDIEEVAAAAAETTQGVEQVLTLVRSLSAMADDLQGLTGQFTTA